MAYPTYLAAALSGATEGQLKYWRQPRGSRGPLLVPELREGRTLLYSFRDVLALRTFAYLRDTVSLQKLRRAVDTLDIIGDAEHLSAYRLATDGDSVIWVRDPECEYIDLVRSPGQHAFPALMADVLEEFRNRRGQEVRPLLRPYPRIRVAPDVRGGYPVVAGTRVDYDLVAGLIADGVPPRKVKDFYPSVDANGARDADRFSRYVEAYTGRAV